ncbi:MAG TPA: hypothetical protein VN258_09350, partial [Mobilitalea sp.]|nr:hypothetical protein [Mobilitalea sp.]
MGKFKITSANNKKKSELIDNQPPSFGKLVLREILHDKLALISFVLLVCILITVFAGSFLFNAESSVKVNLATINKPPSNKFLLGTDGSGRDMIAQIFLGARNSFLIAFGVTILCGIISLIIGLMAGYFGGKVDNI